MAEVRGRLQELAQTMRTGRFPFREKSRLDALSQLEKMGTPEAYRALVEVAADLEPHDPIRMRVIDTLKTVSDADRVAALGAILESPSPFGTLAFEALERIGTPAALMACLGVSGEHPCSGRLDSAYLKAPYFLAIAGAARGFNRVARDRAVRLLGTLAAAARDGDAAESARARVILENPDSIGPLLAVHDLPAAREVLALILDRPDRAVALLDAMKRVRKPEEVWKSLVGIGSPVIAAAAVADGRCDDAVLRDALETCSMQILRSLLDSMPPPSRAAAARRLGDLKDPKSLELLARMAEWCPEAERDAILSVAADMLKAGWRELAGGAGVLRTWIELVRKHGGYPAGREIAALAERFERPEEFEAAAEAMRLADGEIGAEAGRAVWRSAAIRDPVAAERFMANLSVRRRIEWLALRGDSEAKIAVLLGWGFISRDGIAAAQVSDALLEAASADMDMFARALRRADGEQLAEAAAFVGTVGTPAFERKLREALRGADAGLVDRLLSGRARASLDPEVVLAEIRAGGGREGVELVEVSMLPAMRETFAKLVMVSINDARLAGMLRAAIESGGGFDGLRWGFESPFRPAIANALRAMGLKTPGFPMERATAGYYAPGGMGRAREKACELSFAPPMAKGELARFVHESPVASFSISPDGTTAASVSFLPPYIEDGFVWNVETGGEVCCLPERCRLAVFLESGELALWTEMPGSGWASVFTWDLKAGTVPWQGGTLPAVPAAVSPARGSRCFAAVLPPDGRVAVRDEEGRELLLPLGAQTAAVSADLRSLVAYVPAEKALVACDLSSGDPARILASARPRRADGPVSALFMPDGARILARSRTALEMLHFPALARIWKADCERAGETCGADEIALSGDGSLVFAAGRRIIVCRTSDGQVDARLAIPAIRLAISSDASRMLTVHDQTIRSWNLRDTR
ncbi:MAG: hypothetical protein N3A38_04260 [Planctomycetota bacterium]|nr:hypothetical protein [Planctomycetota bacterium]